MDKPRCDFDGCDVPVCDYDMKFTPPTRRYCQEHSEEQRAIFDEWDPAKALGWWIKSLGGAEKATEHILGSGADGVEE